MRGLIDIRGWVPLGKSIALQCGLISQMNNFLCDVHPKYSCAKTTDKCLTHNYFRRACFFFAPIIINMFQDIADR